MFPEIDCLVEMSAPSAANSAVPITRNPVPLMLLPVRILTSTVKLEGADQPLLPVRSEKPVPKELLADCMKVLKAVDVKAPVKRYDVIVENICGCGVNIVASDSVG